MNGGREPTCYLHVGTHKTGTTSLQMLLASNERLLAQAGIHVPRAGRPWPLGGHHNVAWELNDDARFDPAHGTLARLTEEVASVRAPTVCVSSEDFEYLHQKPDRLQTLAAAFRSIGYDVRVVVYLRPQAGYMESLYATLVVPYDMTVGFRRFVDTILADGAFTYRGWTFRFQYTVLLDALARAFGADHVVARAYRSGGPDDELPRDFMSVIASRSSDFTFDGLADVGRLNPAPGWGETMRAFGANVAKAGRRSDGLEDGRGRRAEGDTDPPFHPIGTMTALRITRRFWRDNRRVRERYGVRVSSLEPRHLWKDSVTAWRRDPRRDWRP